MTLKDRIKELADARNISLPTLESTLGFGNSTIVKWDKSIPNADKLKKVAEYFNVSMDYLMGGENSLHTCPDCGLTYCADEYSDIKRHDLLHEKWEKSILKFGKLYASSIENERIKAENRNIVHDKDRSLDERYNAQLEVFRCLFSRSLSAYNYKDDHVCFDDYVAMLLYHKCTEENLDSDLYDKLVGFYGKKIGIPEGETYYKPNLVTFEPKTIAAHLDTQDLTDEELDDVKNYISFVRAKKRK